MRSCQVCQRVKAKRHKPYGLLQSLPQPPRPWSEISMDFVTGLPEVKNPDGTLRFDAILVVVDRYSKMARYIPCRKTITSQELAVVLWEEVFKTFGCPDGIVSDRGSVFTSEFYSALCFYLHSKQRLSTAYHPQTDGQTERQNQALEHYLRTYCAKSDWSKRLFFAEYVYNNSKHSVLKETPSKVLFGYQPTMPWEPKRRPEGDVPAARERARIMKTERENLSVLWREAQEHAEKYYNRKHMEMEYGIDDWVMLSTKNIRFKEPKVSPKFIGPGCPISQSVSDQ